MKPCNVCKTPSVTDICTACSLSGFGYCQFCGSLKPDIIPPFSNENRYECYNCYLERTQEICVAQNEMPTSTPTSGTSGKTTACSTAMKPQPATSSFTEKENTTKEMTIDIAFLAQAVRKWERRFVDCTSPSGRALANLKDEFAKKYGNDELRAILKVIVSEVSREVMSEPIIIEEIVPIIPIFPAGDQRFFPPKPKPKRSRKLRRLTFH